MKKGKFYTIEDYEITREGIIINKHNGHIRKPYPNTKGYLRVQINKKKLFIHKLVAEKYIPNPENKPQVNHKDGNKLNNCVDNLEWVTNQENRNHAVKKGLHLFGEKCPYAKLNNEKVIFIRKYSKEFSISALARIFNVSRCTIQDVIQNKTWKNVNS